MTRRRLLFVLPFPPRPDGRHGGARVTGQLIEALATRHDVAVLHLMEPGDPGASALEAAGARVVGVPQAPAARTLPARLVPRLALLRGIPIWASEVSEPRFAARLEELAAEWRPEIIQIEYPVMGQYLPALAAAPAPRILVDHDVGLGDLRDWGGGVLGRLTGRLDARAWRRFERRVLGAVQAAVVFTDRDRRTLEALGSGVRIVRIPPGTPVPATPLDPAGSLPARILFVGNFAHPPNVDAALRLAREILPGVRARHPDARLELVGPSPTPAIAALAGDGVEVTGEVPSIEPHLDAAALVVAPLRSGGGMRVKVLEALAAGKAVIASPLAIQGLGVTPGDQVLIGESNAELGEGISILLADEGARRALGERARAWAEANLGWEPSVARYEELYAELTGT
jgi:polysaccharide biosynthesis protein PslH